VSRRLFLSGQGNRIQHWDGERLLLHEICSYPTDVSIAIGAQQVFGRNWKGQSSATLAAGNRSTTYVDGVAAVLAHDLPRACKGINLASASAALVLVGLMGLDLVVFGIKSEHFQEPLAIVRR